VHRDFNCRFRSKAIRGAGIGSRKKKPRRMTGLKTVMHGATQGFTQSKPHPFTFAGQHVQIGAGYNSLGHDLLGRAEPRPACRPHSRRVGALTAFNS